MIKEICKITRNERGITLTTLAVTIVLLVIVTGVIAKNSLSTLQLSNLTKLENDIEALNNRVASYYVANGELPIVSESGYNFDKISLQKTLGNDISANDGDYYYTIDLSKIDNITLNYGSGYLETNTLDKYIINEDTHVIYYLKGVNYDGKLRHTVGSNPPIV